MMVMANVCSLHASRCAAKMTCWHTFRSVQCAMYAARSVGLTAVPVIQGMAAVLTTASRLLNRQTPGVPSAQRCNNKQGLQRTLRQQTRHTGQLNADELERLRRLLGTKGLCTIVSRAAGPSREQEQRRVYKEAGATSKKVRLMHAPAGHA